MSILIKGITLEQFYRDLNNVRDMDVGWDVVQLPPHGRLIDADALYGTIEASKDETIGHTTFKETVLLDIRGMPTIIEAEEGER